MSFISDGILTVRIFGAGTAFASAALFLAAGVAFVLDPANKSTSATMLMGILQRAIAPRLLLFRIVGIGSFFALGTVLAMTSHIGLSGGIVLIWAGILYAIGLAATGLTAFRGLQILPLIVRDHGDAATDVKLALARQASLVAIDPRGWFEYGAGALWFAAVGLTLAQIGGTSLMLLSFLCAVLHLLLLTGGTFHRYALFRIGIGAGALVVLPLWYGFAGAMLLKA